MTYPLSPTNCVSFPLRVCLTPPMLILFEVSIIQYLAHIRKITAMMSYKLSIKSSLIIWFVHSGSHDSMIFRNNSFCENIIFKTMVTSQLWKLYLIYLAHIRKITAMMSYKLSIKSQTSNVDNFWIEEYFVELRQEYPIT
jgi:hypothetical protein